MKRKLKWLAIVLAVLLLGFGTALFLGPRDRITVESWQKIQIGMTEEEVAEILGGPGTSRDRPPLFQLVGPRLMEPEDKGVVWDRAKLWTGPRAIIVIEL